MVNEGSKYIQKGDFTIIKTGNVHTYYSLKLTSSLYKIEPELTEDNKHTFPPFQCVVEGNYLEVYKEISDVN